MPCFPGLALAVVRLRRCRRVRLRTSPGICADTPLSWRGKMLMDDKEIALQILLKLMERLDSIPTTKQAVKIADAYKATLQVISQSLPPTPVPDKEY